MKYMPEEKLERSICFVVVFIKFSSFIFFNSDENNLTFEKSWVEEMSIWFLVGFGKIDIVVEVNSFFSLIKRGEVVHVCK